jgi:hypothetical protein
MRGCAAQLQPLRPALLLLWLLPLTLAGALTRQQCVTLLQLELDSMASLHAAYAWDNHTAEPWQATMDSLAAALLARGSVALPVNILILGDSIDRFLVEDVCSMHSGGI